MNSDYVETYEEYTSGKYKYVKGFGRLGCYQGLDYIENLLKNDNYYSEELEDNFVFIQSYINFIEQQCKKQKEVIDKAVEYVKNNLIVSSTLDGKKYYYLNDYGFNYKELLKILQDKEASE